MRPEKDEKRWEKSQSMFHKHKNEPYEERNENRVKYNIENSYGVLKYVDSKEEKEKGFVLEAKEAPGTKGHTMQEKQIDWELKKQIERKGSRRVYSAGTPFVNEAFFYDTSVKNSGSEFMETLKHMLEENQHKTIKDTFGFLEQENEKKENG